MRTRLLLASIVALIAVALVQPYSVWSNGSWMERAHTPDQGGFGEAVVGAGDHIFIVRCHTGTCAFWRYNVTSNTWTTLLTWAPDDPIPQPRSGTALASDGGDHLYVLLGGRYEDVESSARYNFYRYDISANTWSRLANTTHAQGSGDALAWSGYDNAIYGLLGSNEHGTAFARYHSSSNTWETLAFNPAWSGTDDGASLVWTGGAYLYALRGEWDETIPNMEFARYDIPSGTWENMAPVPDIDGVADGASLLWIGNWIADYSDYLFALGGGGAYDPGNPGKEPPGYGFYRYTISADAWTELPSLPYPVGEWVGNRLGFAGGAIYYWQGAPSSYEGEGKAFYMFSIDMVTTTTTQQQTATTTDTQTATTTAATQTTTYQPTTTLTTTQQTTTWTTTQPPTTSPVTQVSNLGVGFALVGIGAGVAVGLAGVGVALTEQMSYCRYCGNKIIRHSRYCQFCGRLVT